MLTGVVDEHRAGDEGADAAAPRHRPRRLTLPGCWGALLLGCVSFTPSLLPRGGVVQGLVWGITAVIGYGLGVLAAAIWRGFADRAAREPQRRSWRVFAVTAVLLVVAAVVLGQVWQAEIRRLVGAGPVDVGLLVAMPFVAAVVFVVLLAIGRGVRWVDHRLAGLLARRIGPRAAATLGWLLAAALVYLIVSGLLLNGLVEAANRAFSVHNATTAEDVSAPSSGLRSGGPGSFVAWGTLGREGRNFAALGPAVADIERLGGQPAVPPIRAYAGLGSAPDAEARAALAVRDLARAGGFARRHLLVVVTTGSGWVDPALADSFEYLTRGDSATVALQYSYLPSWLSYLVDQSKAREAGRALVDAVYGAWSTLPPETRPLLFFAGESLGSFGAEAGFSGEYDLANRADGVLFAGPPNFNPLFREFTDGRDPGSLEVQPIYRQGRIVRFAHDPGVPVPPIDRRWPGSRVLYMMNPSDPIVWWSPRLALHEPDWIAEPPDPNVLDSVVWIPFVTFWQVTADLPFAVDVPGGHGHNYVSRYVDGWTAILPPTGYRPDQLAALREVIG
ncbi:alpha/beta hydrolase [Actinomycetospora cinnamomea]|uniref:Putative membrane protein n=1 Tax=Actinomycetospora cinnamomea TaxID=663609 RepID=A0A2U1EDN1_9PSEU|nr:alpha/beta hydrolase [Actinomycetospora cinnamomea]PVY97987.1 putative membrane protein [Actinomycetospora cinnamomea]